MLAAHENMLHARLTSCARSTRCLGSCAMDLCSVAAGRADISYEIGIGGPWDCAAGAIIVQEAGGQVISVGQPSSKLFTCVPVSPNPI